MQITNRFNAPQTLVNLLKRDNYSRGAAQVSVTSLIGSPRIAILKQKHDADVKRDVSDALWMLLGKALHMVAEQGADEEHIPEERMFLTIAGWTISGAVDLQKVDPVWNRVRVTDFKFTSVYNVMHDKQEWINQLNVYAFLLKRAKGYDIESIQICALLRDWRRAEADRIGYPPSPIHQVVLPLWKESEQEEYVRQRIALHQAAHMADLEGNEPELCTPEERWARPAQWAVFKTGLKRASYVADSEADAQAWVAKSASPIDYLIEMRPGLDVRCKDYCEVSFACSYAKGKGYAT